MESSVATFPFWQVASVCGLGTDVGGTMHYSAATWHTQNLHQDESGSTPRESHTGFAATISREPGEQTPPSNDKPPGQSVLGTQRRCLSKTCCTADRDRQGRCAACGYTGTCNRDCDRRGRRRASYDCANKRLWWPCANVRRSHTLYNVALCRQGGAEPRLWEALATATKYLDSPKSKACDGGVRA